MVPVDLVDLGDQVDQGALANLVGQTILVVQGDQVNLVALVDLVDQVAQVVQVVSED